MIIKLTTDKIDTLKDYVDSDIVKRLDENRNFFMALNEKVYFITFHWLDEKKVTFLPITIISSAPRTAKRSWNASII